MKPNRYIKAMEIGLAHEEKGISYFDLVEKLQHHFDQSYNMESQVTFFYWFLDNFRTKNSDILKLNELKRDIHFFLANHRNSNLPDHKKPIISQVKAPLSWNWFLNGEAAKQYLDYQELVESRKAATQAKKQSNISIGLAIFAIIISGVLGYRTQDVKIVEDNTKTLQLEKENSHFKEELYKAEMMLRVYENDDTR